MGLLVRAREQLCVLPLKNIVETMRPLPLSRLPDGFGPLVGATRIRGETVPVLDLGVLLGQKTPASFTRFVTVRGESDKHAALAVEEVIGVQAFSTDQLEAAGALLKHPSVQGFASSRNELVFLLDGALLIPHDTWQRTLNLEGAR
jgi:purine-binding chemotaxis protein CheW